jgi:hypothetical protein
MQPGWKGRAHTNTSITCHRHAQIKTAKVNRARKMLARHMGEKVQVCLVEEHLRAANKTKASDYKPRRNRLA